VDLRVELGKLCFSKFKGTWGLGKLKVGLKKWTRDFLVYFQTKTSHTAKRKQKSMFSIKKDDNRKF
jgi:hypothetical protein